MRLHSVFIVQREVYTALKTLCMGHLAFRWSLTVCMDVANLCVSTCQVEVKAKSASMFLSDYLELLLFSYFRFCCHHMRKLLPSHQRSLPHSIWRHEIYPHCWIMYPNPPTTSPYSSRTPMLAASCWKNNVLDAGPAWIPANFRVN